MKAEAVEDFLDDKPIYDWNAIPPARSWRYEPIPKFTPGEIARAAMIGLGLFIGGFAFLVLAFAVL